MVRPNYREVANAGFDLCGGYDRVLCDGNYVRALLRAHEVRRTYMNVESIIMLAVSALTMVYLLYALLRPEKF